MSGGFTPLTPDDPREVGGYALRARLGVGGMGRVYLAFDADGRALAIKVVRPEHAEDDEFRRRFAQEVAAARRVRGDCAVPVVDADPTAALPWLATAHVPGPSLRHAVHAHGPFPAPAVLRLVAGVAEGLAAVHACGIVHRDLTPANVLLTEDGPRVIDFGIAHAVAATSLTRTGISVGTPAFMAPEQVRGRSITPAADVFALGHLAVFAAVGRPAFGEGNREAMFFRILGEPPDLAGCPEEIRSLADRCLAKDPADRPSPAEVVALVRERGGPLPGPWLPVAVAASLDAYDASAYRSSPPLVADTDTDHAPPAASTRVDHRTPFATHAGETEVDHRDPAAVRVGGVRADRGRADRGRAGGVRADYPVRRPPARSSGRGALFAGVAIIAATLLVLALGPGKVWDSATGLLGERAGPTTSVPVTTTTEPPPADTLAEGCAEAIASIAAFEELPRSEDWVSGVTGLRHLATGLAAAGRAATNAEVRAAVEAMATDLTSALGHGLTGDGGEFLAKLDQVAASGDALVRACQGTR
ncbi:serine/threonine-protein kinase [Actinosynnema sp. NPDC023587]|uniref:serine/threonine-protein kinase n=1 Tax=Actinosynnema sp. NPDC023587 TaxID=3154695 RepID=UPI0033C612F4